MQTSKFILFFTLFSILTLSNNLPDNKNNYSENAISAIKYLNEKLDTINYFKKTKIRYSSKIIPNDSNINEYYSTDCLEFNDSVVELLILINSCSCNIINNQKFYFNNNHELVNYYSSLFAINCKDKSGFLNHQRERFIDRYQFKRKGEINISLINYNYDIYNYDTVNYRIIIDTLQYEPQIDNDSKFYKLMVSE